jgi:hypothetical protein
MMFFIVFFAVLGIAPIILLLIGLGVIGVGYSIPDHLTPQFKLLLCVMLIVVSFVSLISII